MSDASSSLASIIVTISADASDFMDTMKQCSDSAKAFVEVGASLVATGGAIVGAFTAMVEKTAATGEQFDVMSQRLGIAVGDLSGLSYAASLSGVSLDTVGRSLQILSKNASDLASPTSAASKALNDLGINAENADGSMKSSLQITMAVAAAFQAMPDGINKTADAMAIFGRGGAELIPTLNSLNQAQIDQAASLGVLYTGAEAEAAHNFEVAQINLEAAFAGLGKTIGEDVLPRVQEWITDATQAVQAAKEFAASHQDLTETVLNLSVALIGAGGLLLAVGAVTAAITLLGPVVAAAGGALALMGEASVVVLAVEFVQLFAAINNANAAFKNLSSAQASLNASVGPAAQSLASFGVVVDTVNMSFEDSISAMAKAGQQIAIQSAAVKEGTAAGLDYEKMQADYQDWLQKGTEAADEAAIKQAEFNLAVSTGVDAVLNLSDKQRELVQQLQQLTALGASPGEVIAALGTQIQALGSFMEVTNTAMDANIQYWVKVANAAAAFNATYTPALQAAILQNTLWDESITALASSLQDGTENGNDLNAMMIQGVTDAENVAVSFDEFGKSIAKIFAQHPENLKIGISAPGIDQVNDSLEKQIYDLQTVAFNLTNQNQDYVDQVALLKELNDETPKLSAAMQNQIDGMQAMSHAFDGLSTSVAGEFTKVIEGAESLHDGLKNIAGTIATDMLNALIKGFISPFTNALTSLGKTLGQGLFGGGDSGGGGGIGSIFSSILPFLGFLDVGMPNVPHVGVSVLHPGERVVTAAENNPAGLMALAGAGAGASGGGGTTHNWNVTMNVQGTGNDAALARSVAKQLYNLTRNSGMQIVAAR